MKGTLLLSGLCFLITGNNAEESRQLYTAFGLQYFGRPNSIFCHIFGVKCRIYSKFDYFIEINYFTWP